MSDQADFDEESTRKAYGRPYTSKHPVPTIQGYREHRAELQERQKETEAAQDNEDEGTAGDSKIRRAYDSVKSIAKGEDKPTTDHHPYPTENRNLTDHSQRYNVQQGPPGSEGTKSNPPAKDAGTTDGGNGQGKSATETAASQVDPKEKRQAMKNMKRTGGGREVTDPVTHLPIVIYDQTDKDLQSAPENEPSAGTQARSFTGLSGASKSRSQLDSEKAELQQGHDGMRKMFPPPDFEDTRDEIMRTYKLAMTFGLGSVSAVAVLGLLAIQLVNGLGRDKNQHKSFSYSSTWLWSLTVITSAAGAAFALISVVSGWLSNKVNDIWEDETWDSARQQEIQSRDSEAALPESVAWLNSLLASVWPLINPDLFASLIDTLEDVMQASLPKVVRMVSVDDLGQGSEAIRILGIKWLPTGAASQSVDGKGNLASPKDNSESDRTTPGEGQIENVNENENKNGQGENSVDHKPKANKEAEQERKQREQEQQTIREGMEAEEGDFVNMEMAFAYRARSSGKSLKTKVKNAHLYLKFYLPGGIAIPVWVELRGLIGTMRLRLQLSPDPPFFSLCTLTFLGQPKADLSCVPLSKHNLNLMDVPLISSFVQSAIDAALAEYVAPKSLTLDLKDMLMGDDFKKDTVARGVVMIFIKRARDFKEGDGGIGPIKGSSDSYITVSWGKFGKPAATTRIIETSQEPDWHEWASILVTPDEINAEEKLRIQLWDSDKHTADDDLGRVEVNLKELMHSSKTKNQMCDREDGFTGEDPDEKMPGILTWAVGYFAKAHIQTSELEKQEAEPEIRTKEALKKSVTDAARKKLREATTKDESKELHQQQLQDYKEREDEMIISAPPPDDLPSGILSIQIHNITGLEVQRLSRPTKDDEEEDREDEAEQSDNLPDSYAVIILNHYKIYRTRTKPRNAKPFFNAGTERFVKDWKTAEIMISVRDAREREYDALLGVVYLPLRKVFEKKSQVMASYPLAGGIGYGRARVSMVWRSLELKLPKELMGWDYGTLEVKTPVRATEGGSMMEELEKYRIKLRTNLARVKMQSADAHTFHSNNNADKVHGEWRLKGRHAQESAFLAVRKRYATPLVIEFRKSSLGLDSTPAFAVFWLSELADEEEKTVTIKVWKGGKENLQRAESCCNYEGLQKDEQSVGEIQLTLRFWRGLSVYHKHYADRASNGNVRNVMEVLDTVNDEKMAEESDADGNGDDYSSDSDSEFEKEGNGANQTPKDARPRSSEDAETKRKLQTHANRDLSDDDSDSSSDHKSPISKLKKRATDLVDGDSDGEDDGSRGPRAQLQDYKDHHKQLHRKHRGIMQWKSARSLDWMAGKLKRGVGQVENVFEHSEKDTGVETEV